MRTISALFLTAALLVPATAFADDPPVSQSFTFEDELVSGDLMHPNGEQLLVRRREGRRSLIRLRSGFVPELLKSGEVL